VWKRQICVITPDQGGQKRLELPLPRCARLRELIDFIEVVLKVALQMRLAARSAAFISQERALGPHRLHQWYDPHDLHDAFEIVGQNMEAHLGPDARQPLGQEMRRAHPGFERAERMFDGLPA
jgi:hypothetical protein